MHSAKMALILHFGCGPAKRRIQEIRRIPEFLVSRILIIHVFMWPSGPPKVLHGDSGLHDVEDAIAKGANVNASKDAVAAAPAPAETL